MGSLSCLCMDFPLVVLGLCWAVCGFVFQDSSLWTCLHGPWTCLLTMSFFNTVGSRLLSLDWPCCLAQVWWGRSSLVSSLPCWPCFPAQLLSSKLKPPGALSWTHWGHVPVVPQRDHPDSWHPPWAQPWVLESTHGWLDPLLCAGCPCPGSVPWGSP